MIKFFLNLSIILNKKDKLKYFILFPLIILTMVLETIGVGLVIPFIKSLITGNFTTNYDFIDQFTADLSIKYLLFFFFLFYVLKNIIIIFFQNFQIRFIFNLKTNISNKLFTYYVKQPYAFHLNKNSSEIFRNITAEVDLLSSSSLANFTLLSELLVILGISIFIFFIEPLSASILLFLVLVFYFIYYPTVAKKIKIWSKVRQDKDLIKIKSFLDITRSIKDAIIYSNIDRLSERFLTSNKQSIQLYRKLSFLNYLPRYILEIFAIGSVLTIVFFLLKNESNSEKILPILGLYAAAIFKILPSLNRILVAKQSFKFAKSSINKVFSELNNLEKNQFDYSKSEKISFEKQIKFQNISFIYPNQKNYIFEHSNIKILKNKITGIYGPSGTGKSSFVNILTGLLPLKHGEVFIDDIKIKNNNFQLFGNVGYVSQNFYLLDDTIKNNIIFNKNFSESLFKKTVYNCDLENLISKLPDKENSYIGEGGSLLSGGQIQRIGIARALYSQNNLLILDEATNALDFATEEKIIKNLKTNYKLTIVMITHKIKNLEYCDSIYEIKDKKINLVKDA
jgi:ATP-binding cassette, subfamily B, bacterial PglK